MCIRFGHPTKKTSLCETLHGRWPWPELELPWEPMGSSPERGRRGKGKRKQGHGLGAAWGAARVTMRMLLSLLVRAAAAGCFVLKELDVRKERRRKERRKRKGKEKKKRKNMKKISNSKIFGRKIKDNL
jgi:hypothetical protein